MKMVNIKSDNNGVFMRPETYGDGGTPRRPFSKIKATIKCPCVIREIQGRAVAIGVSLVREGSVWKLSVATVY